MHLIFFNKCNYQDFLKAFGYKTCFSYTSQSMIYLLSYLKAGFMETIEYFQLKPGTFLITQISLKYAMASQ